MSQYLDDLKAQLIGYETMLNVERLDNVQALLEAALDDGVPGDVIETGVWRGGACILMRAILKERGNADKRVFVADSFRGVPLPSWKEDEGDLHHAYDYMRISLEEVKSHFNKRGLLDDQVVFLNGWFSDTLPAIGSNQKFCLIRMDGDMYQSTMESISNLYPKLSPGGYIIEDDYCHIPGPRQAVDDYRLKHNITETIIKIDWAGAYWRKS